MDALTKEAMERMRNIQDAIGDYQRESGLYTFTKPYQFDPGNRKAEKLLLNVVFDCMWLLEMYQEGE